MYLYDVKEGRPFTENHVIRWSKGAPLETDIPRVLFTGVIHSGGENNEYRSVIYYHEDKPWWAGTCKISVPIEEFKVCHLRFMFKHRSSNETKDRNEKPFAMSFVSLMQQNGTTLPDTQHELLVYKVDHKKYDFQDMCYLTLPSRKIELEEGGKRSCNGLTLSNKDLFIIQTNVCSTKLTQNIDLLGLLNWTSEPEQVLNSLDALIKKVSGEEIVKFLQDVLDALFNILMKNTDSDLYDKMVFNCLLHIIGLVSDRKYEHFEPVLDLYIKEGFFATLVHHKLLAILKDLFENLSLSDNEREILLKTMKSLQYIMRFIDRSRVLFSDLLKELIMEHKKDPSLPINPLSLRLNGIVDAAVMGGINNYEKAFFTPEYIEANPDKVAQVVQLKELIASQIPLLEVRIKIHGDVAPPALIPFQQRLEQCFAQMQSHVVSNYGAKSCEIKYEPVTLRRQTSKGTDTNGLSGTSFGSTEGNRSRVSSLTKSQVASLKTFVNFASLSPSSTLTRAGSAYVKSTSTSLSTPSISRKEKKKKRRHTNKERECPESPRPNSQWYTSPVTTPTSSIILDEAPPIFELRQQLTPTRPLRSEVEKERRLSRPPSGQFQNRLSLPSTNGNRDSLGTTDSTASEEDPPPLPAKTREADYCNLPDETDTSLTISQAPSTPRVRNKPVPPVPVETNHITQPPTPPPKRPVKALSSP